MALSSTPAHGANPLPAPAALLGELRQVVLEHLRLFKETLLRKHEEQELKLGKIFDLLLERAGGDGTGAPVEDMWLDVKPLPPEAAPPEAPRETHGLERIGWELVRLQQHVSRELALISREVVLERAARASDPAHARAAAPPRPPAASEARAPPKRRTRAEAAPAPAMPAPDQEASPQQDRTQSARRGSAEPTDGHGGSDSAANSPRGVASWQKGLSEREQACKTPLEHLGLTCWG